MRHKTIWIITGLTCSGKSKFVKALQEQYRACNLINGDVLQAYTNFNVLVNKDKDPGTTKLYHKFDMTKGMFTTYE